MFRVRLSGPEIEPVERFAHLVWEGSLGSPPGHEGDKARPTGTRWSKLLSLEAMEPRLWPDAPGAPPLWHRLLHEGAESDVWTGETVETWSPLGQVSHSSFGELSATTQTIVTMRDRRDGVTDGGVPTFLERSGVQMLRMDDESGPVGAVTFSPFAFIVPIDAGAEEARLELEPDPVVFADLDVRDTELRVLGFGATVEYALVWRLYRGGNSSVVDGITTERGRLFEIGLGLVEGAAYLVGRLAMTVNRNMQRPERDPWFRGRVERAVFDDLELERTTAEDCPELGDVASGTMGTDAIIAIHGTMGCAVPMARSLAVDLDGRGPILRFEHDTWNTIPENADALVAGIQSAGLKRVLFVAHSRGGLVARQAMRDLREAAPDVEARLIAVGTPFAGTPMIGAAESGLLGVRATLGALRLLTGPALDTISRLAGLLIKGRLPVGLRDMHPRETYLKAFRGSSTTGISAVAGTVDPNGPRESYGIAVALQRGGTRGIFHDADTNAAILNDYIVPTASASHRIPADRTLEVECDHFSYFSHPEVRAWLAAYPWHTSTKAARERLEW